MTDRAIIVSAADHAYWPYLSGLLNSIDKRRRVAGIAVGVLDLGLSHDQLSELTSYGAVVATPGWDYDISGFDKPPPPTFRAMTARPHLPRYFPGYENYVWIDADCWVQDWQCVKTLIAEARRWGFAVVPEIDRSYAAFLDNGGSFFDWAYSCFAKCYDETEAQRLAHYPPLNCGVFAAPGKAPVWAVWANELGQVLSRIRTPFFFAEQTALNVVVGSRGVGAALFPARYNWMCNRALPLLSADRKTFLEPHPPYEQLGIIHLAARTREGLWSLIDMTGRLHQRTLTFPPLRQLQSPA
jgi:hypothetical protein